MIVDVLAAEERDPRRATVRGRNADIGKRCPVTSQESFAVWQEAQQIGVQVVSVDEDDVGRGRERRRRRYEEVGKKWPKE